MNPDETHVEPQEDPQEILAVVPRVESPGPALPLDQDIMLLGKVMVASGFFPNTRAASQAIVKILAGRELGFGPIASMTGVYVIKGRVSISANLMAAALKRTRKYNYRITEHTDETCRIRFFEGNDQVGVSEFTLDQAREAGLLSNEVWGKYPRNMLFARAMSNGVRWFAPDVFGGAIFTPEELGVDEEQEPEDA